MRRIPDLVVYQAEGMPGPAVCLVARKPGSRTILVGGRELYVLIFSEIHLAPDPSVKDAVDARVQRGGIQVADALGTFPSDLFRRVALPLSMMNEFSAQRDGPKAVSLKPLHAEGSDAHLYCGHAAFRLKQGSLNRVRTADARPGQPSSCFPFANTRGHFVTFSLGAGGSMYRQTWTLETGARDGTEEGSARRPRARPRAGPQAGPQASPQASPRSSPG